MSGGSSAIVHDDEIRKEFGRMVESEEEELKLDAKEFKGKARKIMEGWADYAFTRGGYRTSPFSGFAKKRILMIGRFLEGKIKYEDLRGELLATKPENSFFNYFAVGGHGKLMNNTGDVIEFALRKKFGERVDSFRAIVDDRGRIDFERVSCGNCPRAGNCSITDGCNCYDRKAYGAAEEKKSRDMKELERIARKYRINLGV